MEYNSEVDRSRQQGMDYNPNDPFSSFVNTGTKVLRWPADFFRSIPSRGNYASPWIFALICAEISAILGGLISFALSDQSVGDFIARIVLTPIGTTVGLFIWAGILHLLVMLIVGAENAGFEATFRALAYSSVTSVIAWVPYVGWIVALYGIYLNIVGIRELHGTTTGRAVLVVLIPAAIVAVLVALVVAAFIALLFSSFGP